MCRDLSKAIKAAQHAGLHRASGSGRLTDGLLQVSDRVEVLDFRSCASGLTWTIDRYICVDS